MSGTEPQGAAEKQRQVRCPHCWSPSAKTYDSRVNEDDTVRRRKKCRACGHRWGTVEIPAEQWADIKRSMFCATEPGETP